MNFLRKFVGDDLQTISEKRTGGLNRLDRLSLSFILMLTLVLYLVGINYMFLDPWENHYSQVAVETMNHNAVFRLWFNNSNNFWSKPPLLFWMLMPFYKIHVSEWMGRLPIILLSMGCLAGFYMMVSRLMTRRTALFSTLLLMMCPQYFMLSRQVMVDLPFLAFNTLAMLSLGLYYFGDFDEEDRISFRFFSIGRRDFYIFLFYFFEGWAFLAKGLLSIVVPGAALFIYMLLSGNYSILFSWKHLKKHLLGILVYLAVLAPWVLYMWYDAGNRFMERFFIFHHFKRVAGTIHKPNDLFTLYIRILAYASFPWVMFIPQAIYRFFNKPKEEGSLARNLFLFSFFAGPFFFLAYSSTKFYHYIAPTLPFLMIMVGSYLDGFFNEKWDKAKALEVVTALLIMGAVARDIGNKKAVLVHIVTFYHGRQVPSMVDFIPVMAVIFALFGIALFLTLFWKRYRKYAALALFFLAGSFIIYYNARVVPAVARSYSLKPLYEKYVELSPERAPIADYYKWLRKSVSFWFTANNETVTFLGSDKEKKVLRFFKKPGTRYAIMRTSDRKRFDSLMKRINKKTRTVAKVPHNILVEVSGEGVKRSLKDANKYIVGEIPEDSVKVGAVFDNAIELLSYRIVNGTTEVEEGTTVKVDLYFKALKDNIKRDYKVFVHNEGDVQMKRTKEDKDMADGFYPTSYWKKGEVVRHTMNVRIPRNTGNNFYTSFNGIFEEEYRANITNYQDVPNDGDNRLRLIKFTIKR